MCGSPFRKIGSSANYQLVGSLIGKLKGIYVTKLLVVLGQLCSKFITQSLYPNTKCSCKAMGNISNEFYQGELTIIIFFW